MDKYKETLHDFTWPELLQHVSAVLARDQKALESNVNYYKKLFNDSNADKEKLNRLFDKLQWISCVTIIFQSCFSASKNKTIS